MFLAKKIKISKGIMNRIKEAVDVAGYSSVDELVATALERELDRIYSSRPDETNEDDSTRKALQGLGYID